jgi:hypothetical protein
MGDDAMAYALEALRSTHEWRRAYDGEGGRLLMVDGSTLEIVLPRGGPRRGSAPVAVGAGDALRRLRAPGRSGKRLTFEQRLAEACSSGRILYTHGPGWHAWEDGATAEEEAACVAVLERRGLAGMGCGLAADRNELFGSSSL